MPSLLRISLQKGSVSLEPTEALQTWCLSSDSSMRSVKCKGLYVTLIGLINAFDTASRQGMWKILEHLGCHQDLNYSHQAK